MAEIDIEINQIAPLSLCHVGQPEERMLLASQMSPTAPGSASREVPAAAPDETGATARNSTKISTAVAQLRAGCADQWGPSRDAS